MALWFAAVAGTVLEQRLRTSELLTPSAQVLAAKFAKAAMIFAAIAIALSAVVFDLTALTVFSGAFGLGLALSLQKVASNLMSGVIILMDRSIKPGDVIQLGSTFGWISSLRARYVSVITRDGAEYLIPNENFVTEQVINWSYSTGASARRSGSASPTTAIRMPCAASRWRRWPRSIASCRRPRRSATSWSSAIRR